MEDTIYKELKIINERGAGVQLSSSWCDVWYQDTSAHRRAVGQGLLLSLCCLIVARFCALHCVVSITDCGKMHSTGGGGGGGGDGGGGIKVEVEVRRRNIQAADPNFDLRAPATAKNAAVKASTRAKHPRLIQEAYRDDRFDSPTRFFTAAPEHPKLGKWTQPSTLKYTITTTAINNHRYADSHIDGGSKGRTALRRAIRPTVADVPLFADSKSHDVSRAFFAKNDTCNKLDNRQNMSAKSAAKTAAVRSGRATCSSFSRASRSSTPPEIGVDLRSRFNSPPVRSGRQQLTATLRVDTPISGKVAQLHPRSVQEHQHHIFQTSIPSPVLCGSFDTRRQINQQQQQRKQQQQRRYERIAVISTTEFDDQGWGATAGLISAESKRSFFPTKGDHRRRNNGEDTDSTASAVAVVEATRERKGGSGSRRGVPREIDLEPIFTANHPRGNDRPEIRYRVRNGSSGGGRGRGSTFLDGATLDFGSNRTANATDHTGEGWANDTGRKMLGQGGEDPGALTSPPPSQALRQTTSSTIEASTVQQSEHQLHDNKRGGKAELGSLIKGAEEKYCCVAADAASSAATSTDHQQQYHQRHCQNRGHNSNNDCSNAEGIEKWVASDPFLIGMRDAMVRERPADVPGFVLEFAARWRM